MAGDADFVRDFEQQRWPLDRWHHRDHVRLAYLLLVEAGVGSAGTKGAFERAADRLRAGIKAHNAAHGEPESPTSGYHETMTIAWLRLVELALLEYGAAESGEAFCDAHPELSQKKTLRLFYSKDLFMSPRAKVEFVEPDLAPLPRARGGIR